MILHMYKSPDGRDLLREYIEDFPDEEIIDALSVIKALKEERFGELYMKRWKKKVHEIYFYKTERVLYAALVHSDIYLLHVCRKTGERTTKEDRQTVLERGKELGNLLRTTIV